MSGTDALQVEMFRFSGLCDSLRDTARELASSGCEPDGGTLQLVSESYRQLRARLVDVVTGIDPDADHGGLVPALPDGETAPSLAWVAVAATQLSRWCDVVHSTPAFVLQEQVAAANAKVVGSKVAAALAERVELDDELELSAPSLQIGNYL